MTNGSAFSQLLPLYTWFLLAALLGFMLLIGRFYQRFSGEKTFYWLFAVPILLFGAEAVRQTRLQVVNEPVELLVSVVAGGLVIGLSALLYWRMTHGRESTPE